MVSMFKLQSRRLEVLRQYRALVVASSYMRSELLKYGFAPEAIHKSSYLLDPGNRTAYAALDAALKTAAPLREKGVVAITVSRTNGPH